MSNHTQVETWANHPVYTHASISSLGRVYTGPFVDARGWRRAGKMRDAKPRDDGYVYIDIMGDCRSVHTLVAEAFLGPRPDGMEVMHLDANPSNNALSNLIYGTHSENQLQRVSDGNHHLAIKTHCKRGHELRDPNLREVGKRHGKRQCRSCHTGYSQAKKHPERTLQEFADIYYRRFMNI